VQKCQLRDAALTAFECARRSFGLTRSYAGKAAGGAGVGAKSKRQGGGSAGQIVGDATHEMLSFKEIYLFVGQPLLGFRLLTQLPLLPASGLGLKRIVLVSQAGHVAEQPTHVSRAADGNASFMLLAVREAGKPACFAASGRVCDNWLSTEPVRACRRAGLSGRRGVPGGHRHLCAQHPHRRHLPGRGVGDTTAPPADRSVWATGGALLG